MMDCTICANERSHGRTVSASRPTRRAPLVPSLGAARAVGAACRVLLDSRIWSHNQKVMSGAVPVSGWAGGFRPRSGEVGGNCAPRVGLGESEFGLGRNPSEVRRGVFDGGVDSLTEDEGAWRVALSGGKRRRTILWPGFPSDSLETKPGLDGRKSQEGAGGGSSARVPRGRGGGGEPVLRDEGGVRGAGVLGGWGMVVDFPSPTGTAQRGVEPRI